MKKTLTVISCLFLVLTFFQITRSFGVFETRFTEDSDIDIAKWHIYVNDYDLNNTTNTFYVDNITYTNNQSVSAGRFAPGVTGSFLLEIDPGDTEVSFEYQISIDLSNSLYDQITIDSIQGINGTNLTANNGVYGRVFPLSDIINGVTDTIRVTFTWNDDGNHDVTDSAMGSADGYFEIPVSISFSQHIE
ncbi:MAG: hypothetical protein IKG27_04950 [Bacilli bacterium]|nr:hypothetical protein [Bacilli bacterium]